MESSSQVPGGLITCAQNPQLSQLLTASHTPAEPDPFISTKARNVSSLSSVLEGKQLKGIGEETVEYLKFEHCSSKTKSHQRGDFGRNNVP